MLLREGCRTRIGLNSAMLPGIVFCAVPRADDPSNEANDETIVARVHALAGQPDIAGIVLLTIDTDFVEPLLGLKQREHQVAACIPESNHYLAVERYQRPGICVHKLPAL